MGMMDSLTGKTTEVRTQFFIYDDGSFRFRKMPFEDTCLVEKKNGEVYKAWKHFYSNELRFDGYGNIHADMITLGFDRDFILDPFNKIPLNGNPNSGKPKSTKETDIKEWTSQIAESQRYKVMNKPGNMLLINKITLFLGLALMFEWLIIGISKAVK